MGTCVWLRAPTEVAGAPTEVAGALHVRGAAATLSCGRRKGHPAPQAQCCPPPQKHLTEGQTRAGGGVDSEKGSASPCALTAEGLDF